MDKLITHSYHVSGMSCGGCATTVKNKLSAANGVKSVTVDLAKKQVEIGSLLELNVDTLQDALSETGYTITELSAAIPL